VNAEVLARLVQLKNLISVAARVRSQRRIYCSVQRFRSVGQSVVVDFVMQDPDFFRLTIPDDF